MRLRYKQSGIWEVNDYWGVDFWEVVGPLGLDIVGLRYGPWR
jgi:hypothetical protein